MSARCQSSPPPLIKCRQAAPAIKGPADRVSELRAGVSRFLPRAGLPLLSDKSSLRWVPRMLVVGAILFAWDASATLGDRFAAARDAVIAMFRSRRRPGKDAQGFLRTLCRQSPGLLATVTTRLRRCVRRIAGRSHWHTAAGAGRWLAFGVDGSRVECPRTAANEAALGCAGRKKTGPQLFVTSVFHVGTGLLWDFRRGTGKASERHHLLDMLDTLPANAMLLADAGFTGYELMRAVIGGGRHFLIRVGASVTLLRKLGWCVEERAGTVYLWPDKVQRQRKAPPLTLRLITLVDGRNRRMNLLTDVLDERELSDAEAATLYGKRWSVELIYRSLKQTMGRRRMLCGNPEHAGVELDWAVVALWVLGMMAADALAAAGHAPARLSVARALRPVRRAIASATPRHARGPTLSERLSSATKDDYTRLRPKEARCPVNKKRDRPPGDPVARMASDIEIALARTLMAQRPAA